MAKDPNRDWQRSIRYFTKTIAKKHKMYNKLRPLDENLARIIREYMSDQKEISIIDVGAGPFSLMGCYLDGFDIKVKPVDMLADEYNTIIENVGYTPFIKTEFDDIEDSAFEDNTFDIVYCHNAIDHTGDIRKALSEIYRICRSGGFVYLWVIQNVGKSLNYRGLHTWNLEPYNGDCRVWNKQTSFMISDILPNPSVSSDGQGHMTCISRKV